MGCLEYKQLVNGTPDEDPEEPFITDIAVYSGQVLANDGILTAPSWMQFVEFDPIIEARVEENTATLPDFIDHQADMINDLNAYVTDRQNKLAAQLEEIDKASN